VTRVGLAITLALAGLVIGCGGEEPKHSNEELAASYEETLPPAFELYVEALAQRESDRICEELFASESVEAIEAESGEPCLLAVSAGNSADLSAEEVELERMQRAEGNRVRVFNDSSGESGEPITFVAEDGEWKVVYEADPAVVEEREEYERRLRELESKVSEGR
jgi:hypothetical protein